MNRSLVCFFLLVSVCKTKREHQALQQTDSTSISARVVSGDSLSSKREIAQPVFDSAGLWGTTTYDVVERWKSTKLDSIENAIDFQILYDQYRFDNQVGILKTVINGDTVVQYFILKFTYHSNDSMKYITGQEQLFGTVPKAITDIQTPGDGMLYLLTNKNDSIEMKEVFANGVTLNDLGLIDFTETYCNIDLSENRFTESGQGSISFSGGGWGDNYGWQKTKSGGRLVRVSRYSH